jgi:membrane protein DedA with SNARE-associated domain
MFAALITWFSNIIAWTGYVGVFFLMVLESMFFPVPSEAVMPFAGFLASRGEFSFWIAALVGTLGTLVGSLLSYAIGYYGGEPLVRKYGKYALLNEKDLDSTKHWFSRHGGITVFVCRFIPVVRHISSVPAGASKMNIWTFSFYTLLGGFIWNTFLLWAGFQLGEHWDLIGEYTRILDIIVIFLLILAVAFFIYKHGSQLRALFKRK